MNKAVAIAATQTNPFKAAMESARNCGQWVVNFMYGTPDRVRITYAFACALLVLAYSITGSAPVGCAS
jgi:hypothetical protein